MRNDDLWEEFLLIMAMVFIGAAGLGLLLAVVKWVFL